MRGSQNGLVMVAVLWLCTLILWLALMISSNIRTTNDSVIQVYQRSQALYYALSGVYEALAHVISKDLQNNRLSFWEPNGKPRTVKFTWGKTKIIIERETDKINVNIVDASELQKILEKINLGYEDSKRLANTIADFIDSDQMARVEGMEKGDYERLGIGYPPFDGKLLSLDQVLVIPGVSPVIFYGFGRSPDAEGEASDTVFPCKNSLFNLLTVYGNKTKLESTKSEEKNDEQEMYTRGDIYRILSAGQVGDKGPWVLLWVVAKLTPHNQSGYEIVYRKII